MGNHDHLSGAMQTGLGVYYLLVSLLNVGFAAYWYSSAKNTRQATLWSIVFVFVVAAVLILPSLAWLYYLDQRSALVAEGAEQA